MSSTQPLPSGSSPNNNDDDKTKKKDNVTQQPTTVNSNSIATTASTKMNDTTTTLVPSITTTTIEQQIQTAQNDLSSLGRVSHRLAMLDTSIKLSQVLDKLLPKLLYRIGSNQKQKQQLLSLPTSSLLTQKLETILNSIHTKLVEMISHTLKRVRNDNDCILPCFGILQQIFFTKGNDSNDTTYQIILPTNVTTTTTSSSSTTSFDPLMINLSLVFVSIGISRCTVIQLAELIPYLLQVYTYYGSCQSYHDITSPAKKSQGNQLTQILLQCIDLLVTTTTTTTTNPKNTTSNSNNKTSSKITTTTTTEDTTKTNDVTKPTIQSYIIQARQICQSNPIVAEALYELFLDVVLYRPLSSISVSNNNNNYNNNNVPPSLSSSIPPAGLSQFGTERLQSSTDWIRNYKRYKTSIINFISPHRIWGIFLASSMVGTRTTTTTTNDEKTDSSNNGLNITKIGTNNNNNNNGNWDPIGIARTVALLIVASGGDDVMSEGGGGGSTSSSELASSALRYHFESYRGSSNSTAEPFGGPYYAVTMSTGLLTLCLGQSHAEQYYSDIPITNYPHHNNEKNLVVHPLSFLSVQRRDDNYNGNNGTEEVPDSVPISQQVKLSTKRRTLIVSDSPVPTAILSFLATKLLDEYPNLFDELLISSNNTSSDPETDPVENDNPTSYATIHRTIGKSLISCFTKLAVQVVGKFLSNTSSMPITTGLSMARAKPYLAAAQLLNSLTIRLSLLYDATSRSKYNIQKSNDTEGNYDDNSDLHQNIESLLAQSLTIVCTVLSPISTNEISNTTSTISSGNDDGSIMIRDYCYGVICTLSRSKFATSPDGYIFTRGVVGGNSTNRNVGDHTKQTVVAVSIETAVLLFGCAANEIDRLRPRAVAALDALLGSYCRVYNVVPSTVGMIPQPSINNIQLPVDQATDMDTEITQANNPWARNNVEVHATGINDDSLQRVSVDREGLARVLVPLLWNASQKRLKSSSSIRIAAARWASDLLKQLDLIKACHLLCYLAGDTDQTASSIAREGLGLRPSFVEIDENLALQTGNDKDSSAVFPDFSEFVSMIYSKNVGSTVKFQTSYYEFGVQGKAATLRFTLLCMLNDLYGGDDDAVGFYLTALRQTLATFLVQRTGGLHDSTMSTTQGGRNAVELLDECTVCLQTVLASSQYARRELIKPDSGSFGFIEMKQLCCHSNSSRTRRHLASACFSLLDDISIWSNMNSGSGTADDELTGWISSSQIDTTLSHCADTLNKINSVNSSSIGLFHGCSYLGSQAVKVFRLRSSMHQGFGNGDTQSIVDTCWSNVCQILQNLGKNLVHPEEVIGNACADGLSIALSYPGLDSPILEGKLYFTISSILTNISTSLTKFGHGEAVNPSRVAKIARAAGICLAASATGVEDEQSRDNENISLSPSRLQCVAALFELLGSSAFRKEEELAISIGEAFADFADAFSPRNAIWSMENTEWPAQHEENFEKKLTPHEQVLYYLLRISFKSNSPPKKVATASALLALIARGTRMLHTDRSCIHRALVRSLLRHLDEIQAVFISLLSYPKSKQLSRESCCLGLAACRGLVKLSAYQDVQGSENHQKLLFAFGQTTNYGGSAMMETQAQAAARRAAEARPSSEISSNQIMEQFGEESEVGGAAGMGEAALGAYREMAAASVSLGREDILYALLILSVSHTYWATPGVRHRYGASSLLGEESDIGSPGSLLELRNALKPSLGQLIPRILRACHDPNKQTREQMNSLWIGLTGGGAEGRLAISTNLLTTMDALLAEASGKFWRARVGACGALSEIIVGREWDELGGGGAILNDDDMYDLKASSAGARLLRLWRVAMRALDDVRGAVREKGETLTRAVRGLTIRLCDPSPPEKSGSKRGRDESIKYEREATAAAGTSLRWLLKHGLNQICAEATGFCMSTLVEVVGVVKPKILEPTLPDLLRSLLLAISSLEPAALNYLQLRTSDHEGLERVRLQISQSGPIASAVNKCIELIPLVGTETQKSIASELDAALRLSSGFATRVAVADTVSSLCTACPSVFRFPASSTANPSVRLLRAFYFASERERGAGSMDKMIHALGNLAALCPGSSVRSLALRACDRYRDSTGSNDDPISRKAAAAALRALAVRAPNQFADGGKNDIWARRVLPAAYIGRKDTDPKISRLWNEVWEEGGSAARFVGSSTKRFGITLEENLLPFVITECIFALQDVSWARRIAGASALTDLCNLGVLGPVLPKSNTATLNNATATETCERAKARAEACHRSLNECIELLARPRIWDGKSKITATAVSIAIKWIPPLVDSKVDESTLLGWTKKGEICNWLPIVVATDKFEGDLFIGDHWFASPSYKVEDEILDENSQQTVASEGNEVLNTVTTIDFEALDEQLETNDQNEPSDDKVFDIADNSLKIATFTGFCRFLVGQAFPNHSPGHHQNVSDEYLPYRSGSLRAFRDLINSLPDNSKFHRIGVFNSVGLRLLEILTEYNNKSQSKSEPPVLIAGAIDAIAACLWRDIGRKGTNLIAKSDLKPDEFLNTIKDVGGKTQPAWTVREASSLLISQFAKQCHIDILRQPSTVASMITTSTDAQADPKFWRVRLAGLKILEKLVERTGSGYGDDSEERRLILEALLPYKEAILQRARKMLKDPESTVTALSSKILAGMSWWP